MSPYAKDLRRALLGAYQAPDDSQWAVAELLGVRPATVRKIVRRQRDTVTPEALPHKGGRPRTRPQPVPDRVRHRLLRRHDLTLPDLCTQMAQEANTRVRVSTLWRL